jgi:DNA modification methylase
MVGSGTTLVEATLSGRRAAGFDIDPLALPPYPANAIDYMRAHKFSLVWLGYPIDFLSQYRKRYIGSEALNGTRVAELPSTTTSIIHAIADSDRSKAAALRRYYSEMTCVLAEMMRVLKPGRAAIVVVGSSVIRGIDTRTYDCLAELGQQVGFKIAHIGVRNLDRDRRMMPARSGQKRNSQIEHRMRQEYVIGFYKPECHNEIG